MRTTVRPYRLLGSLAVLVLVAVLAGDQAPTLRAIYAGTRTDGPETAAAHPSGVVSVATTQLDATVADTMDAPPSSGGDAAAAAPLMSATEAPAPAPATPAPPTPAPATPAPVVVVATPQPTVAPVTTPSGCPTSYFCYPRLGIRGQIIPYTDCSGGTDVGTAIRAYTCLSPNYLMGHAYTQMGNLTGWQAGDVVYAYGKAFTIYNALTEQSCQPPLLPLAPLSMQTSLSPNTCGPVLVVQAR